MQMSMRLTAGAWECQSEVFVLPGSVCWDNGTHSKSAPARGTVQTHLGEAGRCGSAPRGSETSAGPQLLATFGR
jgi:hypothetical protein